MSFGQWGVCGVRDETKQNRAKCSSWLRATDGANISAASEKDTRMQLKHHAATRQPAEPSIGDAAVVQVRAAVPPQI